MKIRTLPLFALLAVACLSLAACMSYVGEKGPLLRVGGAANESAQTLLDRDAGLLTKTDPATGEKAPVPPVPPQTGSDVLAVLLYALLGLSGVGGATYGVKRVVTNAIARYDAEPFVTSDGRPVPEAKIADTIAKA